MPLERIDAPYFYAELERFKQGDILRDVTIPEVAALGAEGTDVTERSLPYCILLTQDCDLEHDFNCARDGPGHDKILPAMLLCPAYLAEPMRHGEHISGRSMQSFKSDQWRLLKSNQVYRYHYLEPYPDLQVPELLRIV
jgi:hypothetical protein